MFIQDILHYEGRFILKLYKKLFSYMPERKIHGFLSVIFTMAGIIVQFTAYYLIWLLLKDVFLGESLDEALKISTTILLLFVSHGLLYLGGVWMSHLAGFRLETRLREKGIRHLLEASNTFFDVHNSGKVRKIIDNNVEQTHMIVAHLIPDQTAAILTPLLMLALVFTLDIYLGIFFVIIVFISLIIMKKMMGETRFMDAYMKKLDELNAGAVEYVRSIPVVKIFNSPVIGFKKLYDSIIEYKEMVYKYSMSCRIPYVAFQWILNIFIVSPVFIALFMVSRGDSPALWSAKVLFFTLFMGLFFSNTMKIMYVSMYRFQANMAVDNLENLFKEMEQKKINFGQDREMKTTDIEFRNVDFSYDGENKILENFSLKLSGNKVYALVGPSGCGKTTLLRLISRLYDYDSGKISIDGREIQKIRTEDLFKHISIVFQDVLLFNGSVMDNIRIGNLSASDDEVKKAAKLANCDEFVEKLPQGYDTFIGENGSNLSGGERQRISIARAFLKDAEIILLDEIAASLDVENEKFIQQSLNKLTKNKTVMIISHRMKSIEKVNQIIVMNNGKIEKSGVHEELLKSSKTYKNMIDSSKKSEEFVF